MVENWPVLAVSVAAVLLVLTALAVLDARMLPATGWARCVLLSLACAAAGALSWLVLAPLVAPQAPGGMYLPIAALGGVAAYLGTIAVRSAGASIPLTIAFAVAWSVLVFVPAAVLSFAPPWESGPLNIAPVDHGGSLAMNVAPGAAALGVLLAMGARAPRLRTVIIRRATGAAAAIALCAGWLVWLVGAELAFDDVTPLILLNGVVGAGGGVVGWLVVQRIRHQSTSLPAVAAGLVCGLVSVTAGAPLFTPVSAAVTGILAGSAACIFTLRRVGSSRRQQWFVVGSHLIAGAVGLGMLGLLATGMGYLFTGDTGATFTGRFSLLERQVLSTLLVAAYSTGVSFLLWSLLKRLPSWLRPARVGSAALLPRPLPAS